MTHHILHMPITEAQVRELRAGDTVTLEETLYGIRDATQIHYRLQSQRVATLCRAVFNQVAMELAGNEPVPASQRLVTTPLR